MSPKSYVALVLDDRSQELLKREFGHFMKKGWKWRGHHMTMCFGDIDPQYCLPLGMKEKIRATTLAVSEGVVAIGVEGAPSRNSVPHVTLCFDASKGFKASDSNSIPASEWKRLPKSLVLSGVVEEIPIKVS
jgi:hypothetical protein